jgi:hypothetical protein
VSFAPAFQSYFCSCKSIFKGNPITGNLSYQPVFPLSGTYSCPRFIKLAWNLKTLSRYSLAGAGVTWKMVHEDWPNTKPSTQGFPLGENTDTEEGNEKFRFITFQDPNTVKLKSVQRVIRSHGAKKSLEGRKKKLTEVTGNFRHFKTDRYQHASAKKQGNDARSSIDIQSFGSTQSLAMSNSTRLQSLIGNSMV